MVTTNIQRRWLAIPLAAAAVSGALEELGGNASTEILRVALSDRDAAIRAAAVEALGLF